MTTKLDELRHVVVYGFGVTNAAVAAALVARGCRVTLIDDRPTDVKVRDAGALGLELDTPGTDGSLTEFLAGADALINAPGMAESHPVFAAARIVGVPIISEFDLAARWDERPLLSITGTNGKTTVTMLVTDMMNRSGLRAAAVGNTDVPLVAALDDADTDVFVVEASSFRLAATSTFRPLVATWLNFAEDHLDVHSSLEAYELAKARSWRDLDASSTAIANADDPIVRRHIGEGEATFQTFGLGRADSGLGHYTVVDGVLVTPAGEPIVAIAEMFRSMPHDVSNALAAAATALAGGATMEGVREALLGFRGLSHRVELVAERDGVRWFDDSKATAPHAVIAAVEGFDSVVLIAGGRNKGLDLSVLGKLRSRVRGVVGIGEAGQDVVDAFTGVPVGCAASMAEAVALAGDMAKSGDVVLLSPGCASFDWYENYGARGDDFAANVAQRVAAAS